MRQGIRVLALAVMILAAAMRCAAASQATGGMKLYVTNSLGDDITVTIARLSTHKAVVRLHASKPERRRSDCWPLMWDEPIIPLSEKR
jgi:hypothetical protein